MHNYIKTKQTYYDEHEINIGTGSTSMEFKSKRHSRNLPASSKIIVNFPGIEVASI